MGLRIVPQCICAYSTGLYRIDCISYTAVHTNGTEFTQQDVFVGYTELCSVVCVCVSTTKHRNIVLEQALREIFVLKTERVAGG